MGTTAHWRRWYLRQRNKKPSRVKQIPQAHRKYALIKTEEDGKFTISPALIDAEDKIRVYYLT